MPTSNSDTQLLAQPLWTAAQLAELLDVPTHRVYKLTRLGHIPCVRLGKSLRFNPPDIMEWIERGGVSLADLRSM